METQKKPSQKLYLYAWLAALFFYALEYAVRSSPSVSFTGLQDLLHLPQVKVSGIVGAYYITYAICSLLAGVLLDAYGARYPLTAGICLLAVGCLLFTISGSTGAYTARLLQGAGSAIAFPSAVYLAVQAFSGKNLATAIGVTQMLGMLGGAAGQKFTATAVNRQVPLLYIWLFLGALALVNAIAVFSFTRTVKTGGAESRGKLLAPYRIVFGNAQSWLCGITAGLLFVPTTVFAMNWGARFLENARHMSHPQAATACAMVPLGWAIGCPLLGWLADKTGRRNAVILAGTVIMALSLLQIAYAPAILPAYISFLLMGAGSGAAMLPYTTIKEVNPEQVKGSATGAINFLVFGSTSLIGPLFTHLYGKSLGQGDATALFNNACLFFVGGILLAALISLFLRRAAPVTA